MLEYIFGNKTVEKIYFYLLVYKECYAKGVADTFGTKLFSVQRQLKKLEEGGIVVSSLKGKTRIYEFNPRYPFLNELKNLLSKAMEFLSEEEIEKYYKKRTRPRKVGKPI